MKYIRISSLGGLYHEFYKPMPRNLNQRGLDVSNGNELDGTSLFWALILDTENIRKIITKLNSASPKYIAVKGNIELFLNQVKEAKQRIGSSEITPKEFFRYLETLSIVCNIYTDCILHPHRLTIQNGFELENYSAKKIYEQCLDKEKNPYLQFIQQYIMPKIQDISPQLVFIDGMPTFYNLAVSRLIRNILPEAHICLSRHSSEYYSLNKLDDRLTNNQYLFKMIDSIILENFSSTENQLINELQNNGDLSSIHNLIYRDSQGIHKTTYNFENNEEKPIIQKTHEFDEVINVHLQPNIKCYWNKCTFCGINKKYHFLHKDANSGDLKEKLLYLEKSLGRNTKYLWFIDEAIHPTQLHEIASFFIVHNVNVVWQARCRIEEALLNTALIDALKKSGLKELRLGLESASLKVLGSMNKFPESFSMELVEKICSCYDAAGISIHFPIIIGFPGESLYDKKMTYDYLNYLRQKYPSVTFNINVFNLDVSSHVYKNADEYGIDEIYQPCDLNDFVGNIVKWKRPAEIPEKQLFRERDQYMREFLYPWMPPDAIAKPYLFYRLSETIRNTLIWKNEYNNTKEDYHYEGGMLITPNTLVWTFDDTRNVYIIYNWSTHHYMIGNTNMITILRILNTPHYIDDVIQKLIEINPEVYTSKDIYSLLIKLLKRGYLKELKRKENVNENR